MYDTVDILLRKEDAPGINFLEEVSSKLQNTIVHSHLRNNSVSVTGYLGTLKVNVKEHRVKIFDNSICKWYLGDNFKTLTISDTKLLFEKLSDELGLPLTNADVTRVDFATNFIMDSPVPVYLHHLGNLSRFHRLEQSRGLYYNNSVNRKELLKQLVFYDKIADYKAKRLCIPPEFLDKNVLRYEYRFLKQLLKQLNVRSLKVENLYEEKYFQSFLDTWYKAYCNISKIRNKRPFSFSNFKSVSDFKNYCTYNYIHSCGGPNEFLKDVEIAQKADFINKSQAYKFREALKDIGSSTILSYESSILTELDKKIDFMYKKYSQSNSRKLQCCSI